MERRAWKAAAKASVRSARGNPKQVTLIFLLAVVGMIAAEWALSLLADNPGSGGQYLSQALSAETRAYILVFLISLVFQFLLVLLAVGYGAMALSISREEPFSLDTLLTGFRLWSRGTLLYVYLSVLIGLLSSLLSLPASYVLTGLYMAEIVSENLLIVLITVFTLLAMVVLSYRYRMVWFLLLDGPEKPVRQLVTEAKQCNRPFRWRLFLLDLSFLPWIALCLLTCGVLFIWKLPYITATYAHAYQDVLTDWEQRKRRMEALKEEQRQRFQMMN